MARTARSLLRLVVAMLLAGVLLAGTLLGIVYSGDQLFHNAATATEVQLPSLQTEAQSPRSSTRPMARCWQRCALLSTASRCR